MIEICVLQIVQQSTLYLKIRKYFPHLIMGHVYTIFSITKLIEGFGGANIILSGGTKFIINNGLFSTKSPKKCTKC